MVLRIVDYFYSPVVNLRPLMETDNYKSFETERLIITPTTEQDAGFILKLFNTPKWLQYIGDRKVYTVEDAKDYILARMLSQLKRLGYSSYTLIRKEDKQKIGTCGLYDREGLEGIDIGFAILTEFENKGYGFEAALKIKEAAFNDFGIDTIKAITTKDNISSQKLLEKLGFELSGTSKLPGDDEELLVYKSENN